MGEEKKKWHDKCAYRLICKLNGACPSRGNLFGLEKTPRGIRTRQPIPLFCHSPPAVNSQSWYREQPPRDSLQRPRVPPYVICTLRCLCLQRSLRLLVHFFLGEQSEDCPAAFLGSMVMTPAWDDVGTRAAFWHTIVLPVLIIQQLKSIYKKMLASSAAAPIVTHALRRLKGHNNSVIAHRQQLKLIRCKPRIFRQYSDERFPFIHLSNSFSFRHLFNIFKPITCDLIT